jgi:hypothetical protein
MIETNANIEKQVEPKNLSTIRLNLNSIFHHFINPTVAKPPFPPSASVGVPSLLKEKTPTPQQ